MEALRVEKVCKDFGGIHAVKDVSFCVQQGEHLAIIGPNGAGAPREANLPIINRRGEPYYGRKDQG